MIGGRGEQHGKRGVHDDLDESRQQMWQGSSWAVWEEEEEEEEGVDSLPF